MMLDYAKFLLAVGYRVAMMDARANLSSDGARATYGHLEPRIWGVVAEGAFRNLRQVTFDYAGLQQGAFLGKTVFAPLRWSQSSKRSTKVSSASLTFLPRCP